MRNLTIAVLAASNKGGLLHAPDCYMEKIIVGPSAKGAVHLDATVKENLKAIATRLDRAVSDLVIIVLDRPRHVQLIEEIRASGAGTRLMLDGDVAGGINAARYETRIDLCVGIGGSPEGITTACAIKALGGFMQARLAPGTDDERERAKDAGLDLDKVMDADDLVRGDNA